MSYVEMELFVKDTHALLEELQRRKVLKKFPDDLQSRALRLLERSGTLLAPEAVTLAPDMADYDSRLHGSFDVPQLLATDITDFWWKGTLEVKGLLKGNKYWKCYAVATRNRFCFFEGPKKKAMKYQLILSSTSNLEVQVEGKKKSNLVLLKEMNFDIITLKFPSSEEETLWFEQYDRTRLPSSINTGNICTTEPHSAINTGSTITSSTINTSSLSNSGPSSENSLEVDRSKTPPPPLTIPPRAASYTAPIGAYEDFTPLTPTMVKEEEDDDEEDEIIESNPPDIWGHFEYCDVYQVEWNFNIDEKILPGQSVLSLHRGQLVHVTDKVNGDWWRVLNSGGDEGYIASCYLSLAYEL